MSTYVPQPVPPASYGAATTQYGNKVSDQNYDWSDLQYRIAALAPGKMSADEAFTLAMSFLMPQMINYQGDGCAITGAEEGTADALTTVSSGMVQDTTAIASDTTSSTDDPTPPDMADASNLCTGITWLYNLVNSQGGETAPQGIDPTAISAVSQACAAFAAVFGETPTALDPQTVCSAILAWSQNPTTNWPPLPDNTENPNGKTGTELLNSLMTALNQISSAFGSDSAMLNSENQQELGNIGTVLNAMKAMLQALLSSESAANNGTKSSG